MITLFITLLCLYAITILVLAIGVGQLPPTVIEKEKITEFSVIIPFRNEAAHLPQLIKSIDQLDYPKHLIEWLFVNDHSTDASVEIIEQWQNNSSNQSTLIHLGKTVGSPKKNAINTAIQQAKHSWLVTTDADVILPKQWLSVFNSSIKNSNFRMIAGPVQLISKGSFFFNFQSLDMISLQAVTMGGFGLKQPFLCNGANLAYRKDFFHQLNGFEGHLHLASGDDIFLLEKAVKYKKDQISYIKNNEAIVKTHAANSLTALINQRKRWASKTGASALILTKCIGGITFITNLAYLILIFMVCLKLVAIQWLLGFWIIKLVVDSFLVFPGLSFFNQKKLIWSFLASSFLHPLFIVYTGLLSLQKTYNWKGREFNRSISNS